HPSLFSTQSLPSNDSLPTFFFPLFLLSSWSHWLLSDTHYPHSYHSIEPRIVILNIALVAVFEVPYVLAAVRWNRDRARRIGEGEAEEWRIPYKVIAVGVGSIAVGAVLGHLDATAVVCSPDSWLQL